MISKMRSLKLDHINDTLIDIFVIFDMEKVNQVWEAQIAGYKTMKPKMDSSKFEKERWIRMKYVDRIFLRNQSKSPYDIIVDKQAILLSKL